MLTINICWENPTSKVININQNYIFAVYYVCNHYVVKIRKTQRINEAVQSKA